MCQGLRHVKALAAILVEMKTKPSTSTHSAGSSPGACPPCNPFSKAIQRLSAALTRWTGSSTAFLLAVLTIVCWGASGPLLGFSDSWQLVMNTITSIITFLMVFLIQRAQNKDSLAIQLKLNEIVAAVNGANNRMIDVEDLSEEELRELHGRYQKLAKRVGDSVESIRTDGKRPAGDTSEVTSEASSGGDRSEAPRFPDADAIRGSLAGPLERRRSPPAVRSDGVKPGGPRPKHESREIP